MDFSWIKDLLFAFGGWLTIPFIVPPDQGGVKITYTPWQTYIKTLGPGLHFKWPLIATWVSINTALTTQQVGPQSLTTGDGQSFVVSAVIKYRVKDPKPLCVYIGDEVDALRDVASGAIKWALVKRTWKEIQDLNGELEREILQQLRREVNEWGFKIYNVTLVDFAPMKSIRLVQETQVHKNEDS